MRSVLAALALVSASSVDPRANDAVAAFSGLCVTLFTGGKSDVDPSRFTVTTLSPETVQKIKPNLTGQTVWDVSGRQSDVHMLVHYEHAGMCVLEVAAANESAIRTEFQSLAQQVGETLGSSPERRDQTRDLDGKPLSNSMWRIKAPKQDVLLALTTYPEPKFMIQHVMSVSFVR